MEDIKYKLKKEIIDALNLETTPEAIDDQAPLFGDGLGLDSIDALEIIVLLDKTYKIKINSPEHARAVFISIQTLSEFIQSHQK